MDWTEAGKQILQTYDGENAKKARLLLMDCKKSGLDPSEALEKIAAEIAQDVSRPGSVQSGPAGMVPTGQKTGSAERAAEDPQKMTAGRTETRSAENPADDPQEIGQDASQIDAPKRGKGRPAGSKDKQKRARRIDANPPKPQALEARRQWAHDRAMETLDTEPEELEVIPAEVVQSDDLEATAESYAEEIKTICNSYVDTVRAGDTKRPEKWVPDLMYYISDRIPHPKTTNIPLLDRLWKIHKQICRRYGTTPTLEKFSDMIGISCTVFSKMVQESSPAYPQLTPADIQTIKKWKAEAGAALADDVTSSDGASVNKIFVLKAAYGWTETAPTQRVEHIQVGAAAYPVLGDITPEE